MVFRYLSHEFREVCVANHGGNGLPAHADAQRSARDAMPAEQVGRSNAFPQGGRKSSAGDAAYRVPAFICHGIAAAGNFMTAFAWKRRERFPLPSRCSCCTTSAPGYRLFKSQ